MKLRKLIKWLWFVLLVLGVGVEYIIVGVIYGTVCVVVLTGLIVILLCEKGWQRFAH